MVDGAIVPAIKAALKQNEIGNASPYKLSYAEFGSSGASFGIFQGDTCVDERARKALRDVLNAAGLDAETVTRIVDAVSVPCPHGSPLGPADQRAADNALSGDKGRAIVDAMDDGIFQIVSSEIDSCIEAARVAAHTIEAPAQIGIGLWVNMTGEPTTLNSWIKGTEVSGVTPPQHPSVNLSDIERYLANSKFFEVHPRNLTHFKDSVQVGVKLLPAAGPGLETVVTTVASSSAGIPSTAALAIPEASAARTMRVRFATNRNRTTGPDLFGAAFYDGADNSVYVTGSIEVVDQGGSPFANWVPDPATLRLDAPSTGSAKPVDKEISSVLRTGNAITDFVDSRADASIGIAPDKKLAGIIFLHGFATSFLDAMSVAAEIADDYGAADVFCFSWPSLGEFGLQQYSLDRGHAYDSGSAIARALGTLLSRIAARTTHATAPLLHIVCHSMGNRTLSAAVQVLQHAAPNLLNAKYFKYALLMAADEDFDALDEAGKLKPLLTLAENIDVYTNSNDAAMFLSQIVNFHSPLGSFGPANFGVLPSDVIWIDCTDVGSTTGDDGSSDNGHQYFRHSEAVIADVRQVLAGVPPDQISNRYEDGDFPQRKYMLPFDPKSAWAVSRGYPTKAAI